MTSGDDWEEGHSMQWLSRIFDRLKLVETVPARLDYCLYDCRTPCSMQRYATCPNVWTAEEIAAREAAEPGSDVPSPHIH